MRRNRLKKGVEIDGKMYYKGSDPHKAAVTGDTVGDPFKDTSGPSMNILIKLSCLIGLCIAPILGEKYKASHPQQGIGSNQIQQIEQVKPEQKMEATTYQIGK